MWRVVDLGTLNSVKTTHYDLISISYTLLLYRQLFTQINHFIFFFRNIFQRFPPTADFRGRRTEFGTRRLEVGLLSSVVGIWYLA